MTDHHFAPEWRTMRAWRGLLPFATGALLAFAAHGQVGPPPGAVVSTTASEQWCESRVRLYDRDRAGYRALVSRLLAKYGVDRKDLHNYEVDHLVPWCACGDDGEENEWLQVLVPDAMAKDVDEKRVCAAIHMHDLNPQNGMTLAEGQQYFFSGKWQR